MTWSDMPAAESLESAKADGECLYVTATNATSNKKITHHKGY